MGRLPGGDAAVGDGPRHPEDGEADRSGEAEGFPRAVVLLGGFLVGAATYQPLSHTLASLARAPAFLVPVSRADWLAATTAWGWEQILRALDRTVAQALAASGGKRVLLVGHSSGGVLGRLYLSPEPFRGQRFEGLEKVSHLVTLGSPHLSRRGAPLRQWVNRTYPGACFAPAVSYTAVGGRLIQGKTAGTLRERAAHYLYRQLCGDGTQWGDGLVPLASAQLDGAHNLVAEGAAHYPLGGTRWYGSEGAVRRWWPLPRHDTRAAGPGDTLSSERT